MGPKRPPPQPAACSPTPYPCNTVTQHTLDNSQTGNKLEMVQALPLPILRGAPPL
jgi:hypothetical protein